MFVDILVIPVQFRRRSASRLTRVQCITPKVILTRLIPLNNNNNNNITLIINRREDSIGLVTTIRVARAPDIILEEVMPVATMNSIGLRKAIDIRRID